MKLTPIQHIEFAKGYQAQHDDMYKDMAEYFSQIQSTILDHDFKNKQVFDFEDFGKDAFLYKLEQYCKQCRLLREIQGLGNSTQK